MTDQKKYTSKLVNARVLIIGGSSGLGYGVAEAALEHGSTVIVAASSPASVEKTLARLTASYPTAAHAGRLAGFPCNLADEATFEAHITQLLADATQAGPLDHVVFTAADPLAVRATAEIDYAFVRQAGMLRFFAPLLVGKALPRYMRPGPASSYTIASGAVAQKPTPGWTVVGAYAAGQHGVVRGLALDLKPLRVNAVLPGLVDTEMWKMEGEEKEQFYASVAKGTTVGKVGEVEDVVEAFLYCMKDRNTSGSLISSNGGSMLM